MQQDKVKPLGKRILVKRNQAQTTKGGIFLPESSKEKPKQGQIIASGCSEMEFKVGDQVLFTSYAGTEIKIDDENEYLILKEDDVLAIVQ